MPDFWKTVIEHVLGWPVAAIFLCLLFKKPLTDLVGRINSIKGPGFDVSATTATAQLKAEAEKVAPDVLKGEIATDNTETALAVRSDLSISDPELKSKVEAVRTFGGDFPIIGEGIRGIKEHLNRLKLPLNSQDTGEILVRHLAVNQLMLRCERTHRLIFGSQIAALHLMDAKGEQSDSMLRVLFEDVRNKEPEFFKNYGFENWIGFLTKESAAIRIVKTGGYAITVYGRSYLQYIGMFATSPKPH